MMVKKDASELSHKRKRHTNSKFGCKNCKQKRVRCDESFPICANCKRKNSDCSYFTLTNQEIGRIKLAHSIRDNQTKLIQSSNDHYVERSFDCLSSELKFDVSTLSSNSSSPHNFSSFSSAIAPAKPGPAHSGYTEPTFINLSMNDFQNQYIVVDSAATRVSTAKEPPSYANSSGSVSPGSKKVLVNGKREAVTFSIQNSDFHVEHKNPSGFDDSVKSLYGRREFLQYLANMINYSSISDLMFSSLIYFAAAYLQNRFDYYNRLSNRTNGKNSIPSSDTRIQSSSSKEHNKESSLQVPDDKNYISNLMNPPNTDIGINENKTHNKSNKVQIKQTNMNTLVSKYRGKSLKQNSAMASSISHECSFSHEILACSSMVIGWTSSYVYDSLASYANMARMMIVVYQGGIDYGKSDIFKFLRFALVFSLRSVYVPSYNAEFLEEFTENLEMLRSTCCNNEDQKLKYHFEFLMEFLTDLILILSKHKTDSKVISYDIELIYTLMQKWYSSFPDECLTVKGSTPDIYKVIYLYYHTTTRCLDAIFPEARYLFTIRFSGPTHIFSISKDFLKPELQTSILRNLSIYLIRLLSFFYRRYSFYTYFLILKNPYNSHIRQNRTISRKLKTISEQHIKRFNSTLFRPEHYPTSVPNEEVCPGKVELFKDDPCIFVRVDKNMESHSKNIEKLDLFNSDFLSLSANGCLIQDYDPIIYSNGDFIPDALNQIVTYDMLREFYCDVTSIISY